MSSTGAENGSWGDRPLVRMATNYALVALVTLFALYPILQIITMASRPGDQLLSTSLGPVPQGATIANFRSLTMETPLLRWVGNSALIALAVTITGVALASPSAYAFSRFRSLDRSSVLNGSFVTQMFPAAVLLL